MPATVAQTRLWDWIPPPTLDIRPSTVELFGITPLAVYPESRARVSRGAKTLGLVATGPPGGE